MKIWIYKDNAQQGPYTLDELKQMKISADTKAWHAGLPKWYPAGILPKLASLFEEGDTAHTAADAGSQDNGATADDTVADVAVTDIEAEIGTTSATTEADDTTVTNKATAADSEEHGDGVPEFRSVAEPPPVPVIAAPPSMPTTPTPPAMPTMRVVPPCPEAYIVWSLVLLVICCTPIAVASLITGIMTITRHNAGKYAAAQKYSEATAWLIMIALALGAIPNIILSAFIL